MAGHRTPGRRFPAPVKATGGKGHWVLGLTSSKLGQCPETQSKLLQTVTLRRTAEPDHPVPCPGPTTAGSSPRIHPQGTPQIMGETSRPRWSLSPAMWRTSTFIGLPSPPSRRPTALEERPWPGPGPPLPGQEPQGQCSQGEGHGDPLLSYTPSLGQKQSLVFAELPLWAEVGRLCAHWSGR